MTKNIAKEFYVGKADKGSDLSLLFILEDKKEVRLKISRDMAYEMILTLNLSLDTKGLLKPLPKDVH